MNSYIENVNNSYEFKELYRKQGSSNTAVLLLQGFGSCVEETKLFIKYLEKKEYTIIIPYLTNYSKDDGSNYHGANDMEPEDWLEESRLWLKKISEEFENIFIVGFSFGGNLALSLASENKIKNLKGTIVLEVPLFFTKKIAFMLAVVKPVLRAFGIKKIQKSRIMYRSGYQKERGPDSVILLKIVGKIDKFIKNVTREVIKNIKVPFLVIQAEKSDLLKTNSGKYLFDNVQSEQKEIYHLKVNNHDLNLLDEEGKMLMLEKINVFFEKHID